MMQLASKAEAGEDKWLFAKLGAAAGFGESGGFGTLTPQRLEILDKAVAALGEIGKGEPTERRDDEERLELEMMSALLGSLDPTYGKYLERLEYLVKTPASDKILAVKAFSIFHTAVPCVPINCASPCSV